MAGTTLASWWQYSRWGWVITRNSRITLPTGAELTAVQSFCNLFWNPSTRIGTRPWLEDKFRRTAIGSQTNAAANEPAWVNIKRMGVISRDLKKIPMTDAEKGYVDTIIAATGNRRYGTSPYYGNTV